MTKRGAALLLAALFSALVWLSLAMIVYAALPKHAGPQPALNVSAARVLEVGYSARRRQP